jgi:hypothetical protein
MAKMLSNRSRSGGVTWETFQRSKKRFPLMRPKLPGSSLSGVASYRGAVNQLLKRVVREIRTTLCGNRGRVTASGHPVGGR